MLFALRSLALGFGTYSYFVVSFPLNPCCYFFLSSTPQELRHYADEYVTVYDAEDDEEWRLVISEVIAFMQVI